MKIAYPKKLTSSPTCKSPATTSPAPSQVRATRKSPESSTLLPSMAACQTPAETPASRVRCDCSV